MPTWVNYTIVVSISAMNIRRKKSHRYFGVCTWRLARHKAISLGISGGLSVLCMEVGRVNIGVGAF